MNAKKIMGAVLVALLAAALFVGAGAATDVNYGTVFIGQNTIPTGSAGTYFNGAYSVTLDATNGVSGDNVEGTYTSAAKDTIYVSKPTAKYTVVGKLGSTTQYIVNNGGKVYDGSTFQTFGVTSASDKVTVEALLITFPSGKVEKQMGASPNFGSLEAGTYSVQAIFNDENFVAGFNEGALLDQNVFSFTVVEVNDATLAASVDTVYEGEYITLTIEGTLGVTYHLIATGMTIAQNQIVTVTDNGNGDYSFTMPNTGKVTIQAKITEDEDVTVELYNEGAAIENTKIEIAVSAPVVTATLEKASYFVGDVITISGTSTAGEALTFTIQGTNFAETPMTAVKSEPGKTWKYELKTENIETIAGKKLDVGTYTISVKQDGDVVATVALVLKQPFLTLTDAPEVIVQDTKAEFKGTAEVTNKIYYYIFGTNFFNAGQKPVDTKKTTFTIKLDADFTKNMSAGQYFMVVQHPMYDGNCHTKDG